MRPEFYADVKKLVQLPEWVMYEKLLEDERQMIIAAFETGPVEKIMELRSKMEELKKVMRLPHDLVKEHEARLKT